MRVVLSVDMEAIPGISDAREVLAGCEQYWERGRPRMAAHTAAAARGLLDGGADEVVVLDNHASGNPQNVRQDELPDGARLETWSVFDLREHGVDGMLQVGYHPRCGVDGFISHTYVPRLRIRVGDELISESHGRAWAAGVPLLGIAGNADHERHLGSLFGTPFLVVQESAGRTGSRPAFESDEAADDAVRAFAERSLRDIDSAPVHAAPTGRTLCAVVPGTRSETRLRTWADAREPIAAAMAAGMAPFMPLLSGLDLSSREAMRAQDAERLAALEEAFVAWAGEREADWL